MKYAVVLLTLLSTAAPAWADGEVTLATEPLTVTSDLFAVYGVTLIRGGKDVGPGFLALDLASAVEGSPLAVEHAGHARGWAIANVSLAVIGAGLLAGSVASYSASNDTLEGWPDLIPVRGRSAVSPLLTVGALVALAGAVVARYATYEEILLSVSAYDHDTGR